MKIVSFVSCEDIRMETGNKVSLMGVFEGLLIDGSTVLQWPTQVRAAAQLRFQLEETDPAPTEIEFKISVDQREIVKGVGQITITRPDLPVAMAIPGLMIPVDAPGVLHFIFKLRKPGEQEWGPFLFDVPIEIVNRA